jgi:SNF2 family DNA or RNA helicase
MIQISKAHKVVGVPHRADLANLFPKARTVTFQGNATILIPHGFVETKLLRNLGFDIPAPITTHYDWSGGTPFDIQRRTAALLTTHQRAYVLNGMGTGKTKAALWAFDYLRSVGLARRCLVSAPLSTLNFVWAREAFATVPHLSVGILHRSTRQKRLDVLAEDHDIYVVNPDGLALIADELRHRQDIDCFILDELATFRNGSAKRSKVAKAIAEKMSWVWGMTGSPTPNEPTDAWGQARIITPERVPKFFGRFRDEVMVKITSFKYASRKNAMDVVFNALQPSVRFTLDDVVELPDVVERTVDIDLGPKQAKVYEQLRQHAHAQVQSKEITAANAGAVLSKLLQVSLGYVYTKKKEVVALDNDLRLDKLVDDVMSTDRKVLVFVPFVHALEGILKRLKEEGIDTAAVHGGVPQGERNRIFGLFQNTSNIRVIVAHPACMSHGLTLTAADTVIWFGPLPNLETFEQANARIRRVGQKHRQQVLMYQSTPAEKRMYAKLRAKQKVQDGLLDMFAEAT